MAEFEQLIVQLMSTDNAARGQAERAFNDAVKQAPDTLTMALVQAIRTSQNQPVRELSMVLLRKTLISKESVEKPGTTEKQTVRFWSKLNQQTQQTIKTELLAAVEQEPVASGRKKLCDTISELALFLTAFGEVESDITQQWPQLLPFLFTLTKSENDEHRKSSLDIFSKLCLYLGESLVSHFDVLKQVLQAGLTDQKSLRVRLAALGACVSFVQLLEGDADKLQLKDWIPVMFDVVSTCLNHKQQDEALDALQILVELADVEPTFLRPHLTTVVNAMLTIANTKQLQDGIRQLGLEFLVTLAEQRAGMVRKVPNFVQNLVPVVLNFMLDIEEDPEWGTHDDDDDDEVDANNHSVGSECLDRLALSLGGKTLIPILFGMIPKLLQSTEWTQRFTGLTSISLVGEGCHRFLVPHLDNVITMILPHFTDPHPRVRWAACNTFGQMFTDFGPTIQSKYHARVLPALMNVMEDRDNPRVQSHAASAVINFCENATIEILDPYLNTLMAKLASLLQGGNKMVLEQAITAIAALADVVEDRFASYYDTFMPFLKEVLRNANGKDMRMLRGKAMECITLIGVAVGKEKFYADAKDVVQVLYATQQSNLEPDDPQISFLLQAWARVCKALGQEFVPYLEVVMPPLLHSAGLDPDLTVQGDDEGNAEQDGWQYIPIGDKRIGINTTLMEEKATACNMIYQYAAELKEGFFPYVEKVATVLIPLVKFYFHDGVRRAAVSAMSALLESVKRHLELTGQSNQPLVALFGLILTNLNEAIQQEIDVELIALMFEILGECIDVCGNLMTEAQIRSVFEAIKAEIGEREERMKGRLEEKQSEDFDEEEAEKLEVENEKEEEVMAELGEVIGKLAKVHKAGVLRSFSETLFPIAIQLMHPQKAPHDRQIGLCMLDDMLEHCEGAALPLYQTFLPAMVNYITDSNPSVRQAAVFGIGLCAQFGGPSMGSIILDIFRRLDSVIKHSESRTTENVHATENAISAVAKIIRFQASAVDINQLMPVFLSYLPVNEDEVEARVTYDNLTIFIEQHSSVVLGNNFQNLPQLLNILGTAINTGMVTENTNAKMIEIVKKLVQAVPADAVQQVLAALPQELTAKLTQVIRGQ